MIQLPANYLRDYQDRGIDGCREAYRRGRRAPVLVSPTGSGKSRCCAAIAALTISKGGRVLALAPRLEILDQLVRELAALSIPVRSIQADRDIGPQDAPVVVASIWTLSTPRWCNQLPPADLIVIDEAHRALAERSYKELLSAYASSRLLGMTATPARSDGRGLIEVFDEIVVATTTAELTNQGFLVPCRVVVPDGDGETLALPVLLAYQQFAAGRLAIVFAANIPHAKQIVEELRAADLSVGLVTGKTPDVARTEIMANFAAGSIRILVNVACFVEGLDIPACSAAIFARKFNHVGPYLQAIGRVLRLSPGKQDAIVLDLLGSALNPELGSPTRERSYSLTGAGIRSRAVVDPIRQCRSCGSIADSGPSSCPFCGAEYPIRALRPLRSDHRGLVDLDTATRRPPKPMRPRSMESNRPGICKACHQPFAKGTPIQWAKDQGAWHQVCP